MDNQKFIDKCRELVLKYANEHSEKSGGFIIGMSNICVVWSSKVLQNNKACLSTTLPDGMYYELIYDGNKKELYFDAYKKFENIKFDIE